MELVVTVALSSIVIAAALTLLLFGARVQRASNDEAGEQQTVRIVLSALENIAGSGRIHSVQTTKDGWDLLGESGTTLLQYKDGALRSGENGGNILLDGLQTAYADLDGALLTFQMETRQHSYRTAVFCRTQVEQDADSSSEILETTKKNETLPSTDLTPKEKDARYEFLMTLTGEYGSTGKTKNTEEYYASLYYRYRYVENNSDWGAGTPWCACFLSWAAEANKANLTLNEQNKPPLFASVDEGVEKFKDGSFGAWKQYDGEGEKPIPGDYIFFDWDRNGDADHVGAVLYTDTGKNLVYTIEGNSGGKVAVHSYRLTDSRIMGYGVLDWKAQPETTEGKSV